MLNCAVPLIEIPGVRKEFEVVTVPKKMIKVDAASQLGDDDWEKIEHEPQDNIDRSKPLYATVVSHSPG